MSEEEKASPSSSAAAPDAGSRPVVLALVGLMFVALVIGAMIVAGAIQKRIESAWNMLDEEHQAELAPQPDPVPAPAPKLPQPVPREEQPKVTVPKPPATPPEVDGSPLPGPTAPVIAGVAPETPWLPFPETTRLQRIGVGSALSQLDPQPIWGAVLQSKPQLFLMTGDNVLGDIKSADMRELSAAYRALLSVPEFSRVRGELPFLATWNDHDYGANDAGGTFEYREGSERLFREFWGMPRESGRRAGVYSARIAGPPGERVQIIMLDTRSFRSAYKVKQPDAMNWGKYAPDDNPMKTMLGYEQWIWLEGELKKPAEVRLIVSSIQVLSEGHGFERWGNFPLEREKLMGLINKTQAKGVVLLSGDRHVAAIYALTLPGNQTVPELTSSSLNNPYGPARDQRTPELLSDIYDKENFGLVDIDWAGRTVRLSIHSLSGATVEDLKLKFSDLGHSR